MLYLGSERRVAGRRGLRQNINSRPRHCTSSSQHRTMSANSRSSFAPRQSTAASTQRLELPAYENPQHSLNAAQQRELQGLEKLESLEILKKHLEHANDSVTNTAGDINDRFTERQTSWRKRKAKRAQQEMNQDDADLQEEETDLEAMRQRVDKMTQHMEETVRKIIDSSKYVESIKNGIQEVQRQATDDAVRTTQHTQSQTHARDTTATAAADDDSESLADFDPTDPASTTPRAASLSQLYTSKLERDKDRWQTFSLRTRYAQHKDYISFRDVLHDAQHPEGETESPNPTTWFSDRPGSPAPGITRRSRTSRDNGDDNAGSGSESDTSDIAIAREHISTKCPLTLREFEDPVTSTHCPHSFERSAILSLIHGSRERVVQCPVPGCAQMLTEADLRRDPRMVRKIKRLQTAKARAAEEGGEDSDGEGGEGDGRERTVVEEIGSEDDDEMEGLIGGGGGGRRAWSVRPKQELRSSQPPRASRPPRATAEIVSMPGSETEGE